MNSIVRIFLRQIFKRLSVRIILKFCDFIPQSRNDTSQQTMQTRSRPSHIRLGKKTAMQFSMKVFSKENPEWMIHVLKSTRHTTFGKLSKSRDITGSSIS